MGDHKDNGINIDPAFVRALAELLDDTQLSEIEVEDGTRKIRVARTLTAAAAPAHYAPAPVAAPAAPRSAEHTSELQSLMRISYAVFCLKKKTIGHQTSILLNSTKPHHAIRTI